MTDSVSFSLPERSGVRIACFHVRMKVVLNVKVSRTIGMGANQDPGYRGQEEKSIGEEKRLNTASEGVQRNK